MFTITSVVNVLGRGSGEHQRSRHLVNGKVTKPRQFLGPTFVGCVVLDQLQVVMPITEWDNRHTSHPTFQCLPHLSQAPSSGDGGKHVVHCNVNILKSSRSHVQSPCLGERRGCQAETSKGSWYLTPSDRLRTTSPTGMPVYCPHN